jgi:hypothetical protein
MSRFLSLLGASLGGTVGWVIGAKAGLMTGYLLSVVGTGVGMFYAARLARQYLP